MKEILRATQEEARLSRKMADQSRIPAEEMKKDSAAMKTVIVPLLFYTVRLIFLS